MKAKIYAHCNITQVQLSNEFHTDSEMQNVVFSAVYFSQTILS